VARVGWNWRERKTREQEYNRMHSWQKEWEREMQGSH